MKVLVADDNASDRLLLSKVISKQGHDVILAENGNQAIERYLEDFPDIILMDALMPELNGMAATKEIKRLAGENLVPIIFLTSLTDAKSLADCLASGGDDFLTKPYNPVILKAKLDALVRMKTMHETLQHQRDEIAENHHHMLQEQMVAKKVFDNIAHSGCLDAQNIKYMLSPLAVFNGDLLLAARKPSGGMYVLLGDFTGHGLPAAIGALPMAEIFYGMAAKGYDLRVILRELNLKLKTILPAGFFCCAAVVDLCFVKRKMSIWMGGIPDGYLLNAKTKVLTPLKSRHLPLGIIGDREFDDEFTDYDMALGDRLFLWSDGIVESRNTAGEMYGEQRLLANFEHEIAVDSLFGFIQQDVNKFVGSSAGNDDTTMIELTMVTEPELNAELEGMRQLAIETPCDWSMEYKVGVDSLKHFNPLPLLMHIMMEVPVSRFIGGQLLTVLSELYTNALEHGVLQLDSSIKNTQAGFSKYYAQKDEALNALIEGRITVKMTNQSKEAGKGVFTLTVEDSGKGFDFSEQLSCLNSIGDNKPSGRGISLVNSLCHSLEYQGCGNRVVAKINW